jgi:drug/metabolite transporter (DMT)-like permease
MYHAVEGLPMKPAVIVGVILIVLGAVALVYQGITYTSQEKVVDLGPLKVEAKKEKTIPLPPLLGALLLVGGVVLVAVSARR